eukprot:29130-Pelagococcus_subviridis.AAC.6
MYMSDGTSGDATPARKRTADGDPDEASDDGAESGRRGRGLKARDPGRRETPGKVLKDRRSPRRRGRTGTSVNEERAREDQRDAPRECGRREEDHVPAERAREREPRAETVAQDAHERVPDRAARVLRGGYRARPEGRIARRHAELLLEKVRQRGRDERHAEVVRERGGHPGEERVADDAAEEAPAGGLGLGGRRHRRAARDLASSSDDVAWST